MASHPPHPPRPGAPPVTNRRPVPSRIEDTSPVVANPPGRVRVTLRLDADVDAFLRAQGAGHLTRMNDVLAACMPARVAGMVQGGEAAGGSIPGAMTARGADEARVVEVRRPFTAALEADRARRDAEHAALPEEAKRRLRMEELKAAATARKRGAVGRRLP